MHLIQRLLLLSPILAISAEHITVTYHFWDKDDQIAEKAEFYTRHVANSNRYWTSNFVLLQHDKKINAIQISTEDWKSASVEETVDSANLDVFFSSVFQKFANKLYTNLILDTKPAFDAQVFETSSAAYSDFLLPSERAFWNVVSGATKKNHIFALLINKDSFEAWEATLNYVAALKRANIHGFVIDCDKLPQRCLITPAIEGPILFAYYDEEHFKIFYGPFRAENLQEWMLSLNRPAITSLTEDQVPYWRSGMIPGFPNTQETVTIFFTNSKKNQVYRNFVKYAGSEHGNYHLGMVVDKKVEQWGHYPAFITMKPNDEYVKAITLYEDVTYDRMADFLENGTHPSCHPLTKADEFLYATSTRLPLVVFFDPLNVRNVTNFRKMASQHQVEPERKHHSAAVSGFDLFGMYLMSVFNVDSAKYVVLTRKDKGWCVYKKDIENQKAAEFVGWLEITIKTPCHAFIDDFKLPIRRLNLIERYEDVADLENELTAVEVSHDEL